MSNRLTYEDVLKELRELRQECAVLHAEGRLLRERLEVAGIQLERHRSAKDILAQVAAKYHVTVDAMRSPRKTRALCEPRFEAAWLIAILTSLSLPQIGLLMGGRDHTTVLNQIRRFAHLHHLPMPSEATVALAEEVLEKAPDLGRRERARKPTRTWAPASTLASRPAEGRA